MTIINIYAPKITYIKNNIELQYPTFKTELIFQTKKINKTMLDLNHTLDQMYLRCIQHSIQIAVQ